MLSSDCFQSNGFSLLGEKFILVLSHCPPSAEVNSNLKNLFYNKQQGHFHHLGRIILMKEKPIMKEDGGGSLVLFGLTYTAATIIRS